MRSVACLLLATIGSMAAAATAAAARYTIEQLLAADEISGLAFSPDNRALLVTSNRSGVANLYSMPISGGELTPVTRSTAESLYGIGYFPRDTRILYTSDQGGNELNHVYVREVDGSVRDLTPGEKLKAKFVAWARDGASFFVATNERDARYFDLYEYSASDYSRTLLFENDRAYQIECVSPDRRYVALSRIVDNANTDAYVYDREEERLTRLTPDSGNVASTPQDFSPDGTSLYYTTDENHEFQYLVRQSLSTGERETVYHTSWDVQSARFSADDRYLIVAVNEDARTRVHLFDGETLSRLDLPDAGEGTIETFVVARGAPLAAVVRGNGNIPGDLDLLDLESGARKRLLRSLPEGVPENDLVPGKVVRFASYDGVEIPGVLYIPRDAQRGDARPAAIWVHGGPGGESRIGYKPLTQYLVNAGYVVYEINNRGSSGSGKTFYHLDDHRHGDADLDDVVASKKMLAATGYVDPPRIGIMGGSYGGYMTLAGLAFRPNEFAVGVNMYGVSNWVRLLGAVPPWWEDLKRLLASEVGDADTDGEYLRRISPVFHADRIVKPLLVLQGANDPRVLQVESDDIVDEVRKRGVPVEYIVFPDEGHSFRKKANQIVAYRAVRSFLDRHLRAATPGGAQAAGTESTRLERFFEAVFQRGVDRSPIFQSRLGIRRDQDKWDDISEARQLEDIALTHQDLVTLRSFDYEQLTPEAQLSYRLFEWAAQESIDSFQWRLHRYRVTQMGGLHTRVATTLLNNHPITTLDDAEDYIARLEGIEPLMGQLIDVLRKQEAIGVRPPAFIFPLVIGESQNLITGRPFEDTSIDSPLYADVTGKLAKASLPEEQKTRLRARAAAALREHVGPGYRRLIEHLRTAQQSATNDAGVWKLPNGAAYYEHALRSYTTLPITADELHELGLREVARIHEEMRKVVADTSFRGSLQDFFEHLRTDPKLYYPDTRAGRRRYLADAQRLIDEISARQDELFRLQPGAELVVRAVEPWREKSAAKAFYQSPPQDGSRPGIYYVNLYDMKAQPKYELAAVTYHEAIPGHHVETVVAYELPGLPKFRKYAGYAAFSEGWGLYAERLPKELGLYPDPYQDFGRLAFELMRAARLVVDTGLHARRWTREQAVKYLDDTMPSSHYDNERSIDRYIVLPGQATSYSVGMLKLLELREAAKKALGNRFDLRDFHDVVLGSGPLPLPMLEENVRSWIGGAR